MGYFSTVYATDLPHRAISVYMYLRDRADKEGKCFPSIRTIGRELGLSRSSVQRSLKDLEHSGFLTREPRFRENGSNTSNMYYIK